MIRSKERISQLVLQARDKTRRAMKGPLEPAFSGNVKWPVNCTVGPGLEGAIACESTIGYVNGSQGMLLYRGYDIFDLCAHSTFEEVSYLLKHGKLPNSKELDAYKARLIQHRRVPETLRMFMSFPVEEMNTMAALTLGINLMRMEFTTVDREVSRPGVQAAIGTDEDSIAMETMPEGKKQAVYEFDQKRRHRVRAGVAAKRQAAGFLSCAHLTAGVATLTAAISRLREGLMPLEPDDSLGHAANYLYMVTGRKPTPVEEKIMDISLILHADHGMNASTFAAIVVASTLSDMYASVGAGVAALNGPLHGGANEMVVRTLREIGSPDKVPSWLKKTMAARGKVMGFGHRVYKTYDPRARVLGPIAKAMTGANREEQQLFETALRLEREVAASFGEKKKVYPNVDFYSGLVYAGLGIPSELFTPTFAVARVAGWTARVLEYLESNRIFRPRAIYRGPLDLEYTRIEKR